MEHEEQKPPEEPHTDEPREGSLPPEEESSESATPEPEQETPDPDQTGRSPEGESGGDS
jgi:hypothetical protein